MLLFVANGPSQSLRKGGGEGGRPKAITMPSQQHDVLSNFACLAFLSRSLMLLLLLKWQNVYVDSSFVFVRDTKQRSMYKDSVLVNWYIWSVYVPLNVKKMEGRDFQFFTQYSSDFKLKSFPEKNVSIIQCNVCSMTTMKLNVLRVYEQVITIYGFLI